MKINMQVKAFLCGILERILKLCYNRGDFDILQGDSSMEELHLFDDILEKDEEIVKIIKPSKRRYWNSLLFPWGIPLFWPHFIIIMAATLFFTLPLLYAHGYKNLWYAYTNKRIIIRKGTIGVDYRSLAYKDISVDSVDVGFLDKFSNTGTLHFKSPSAGITLSYVPDPYNQMREIKEYMSTVNIG